MKNILRSILGWLERKFPDKVMLTIADHDALMKRIESLEKIAISEDRFKLIESEINKFNVSLGFGIANKNPVSFQPFQR